MYEPQRRSFHQRCFHFRGTHVRGTHVRAVIVIAVLSVLILPCIAMASLANRPLNWAKSGFSHHSEAVEHLTIRGADSRGRRTFIRFSLANAAYQKGKLTVTLLQRLGGGKGVYGSASFKRGTYTIFKDRFGLQAGGNRLEIKDGKLHMTFAVGQLHGTVILTPRGPKLRLRDRDSTGWIHRDLIAPWGSLAVTIQPKGKPLIQLTTTVFVVHEASTIKAHRTYDRSVRIHSMRGRRAVVVDYIVAPKERQHRPLGFVILRQGKQRFVGKITKEVRSAEQRDHDNDYRVPWHIDVQAQRGGKTATVQVRVARQIKRKDDLAKLGFFTRKIVSLLIHPYTYTLKAAWTATIQSSKSAGDLASASTARTVALRAVAAKSAMAPAVAPTVTKAIAEQPAAITGTGELTYAQAR